MNEKPNVKPGDWIKIGSLDGVVCQIFNDDFIKNGIEVVFIGNKGDAVNLDVCWNGEKWVSARDGDLGGYADKYDRLREYVAILRRGRY